MESCCWTTKSSGICGAPAEIRYCLPLCEDHVSSFQSLRTSELRRYAGYSGVASFPGYCYFLLLPGETVKIGYSNTEETLRRRIKDLRRDFEKEYGPDSCEVLAIIKGGYTAEAVLHHRFANDRLPGYGERFNLSDEILDYLATTPRVHFDWLGTI